jgi:hypothetical protein
MHNIIAGDFFLLSTCHTNIAENAGEVWLFFLDRKALYRLQGTVQAWSHGEKLWGLSWSAPPQRALP